MKNIKLLTNNKFILNIYKYFNIYIHICGRKKGTCIYEEEEINKQKT